MAAGKETLLSPSTVLLFGRAVEDLTVGKDHDPHPDVPRPGGNKLLENQLIAEDDSKKRTAQFARIYGFSYEGTYYDLPRPMLFLVHGKGYELTEDNPAKKVTEAARAPGDPSVSGVAAADFQLANDIQVWSYDKADYTIRMDVETGMFEQVLLDMVFGEGPLVSGARVSGARVSGARVSGARVSGARLSGARLGGGRGDASD